MGWGTNLTTQLYYSRKTYNSKYEVQQDYDDEDKMINTLKSELKNLAIMTEPQKWIPKDELESCDPMYYISNRVEQILQDLEDAIIDKWRYGILLDNWENCHNQDTGLGKEEPEDWKYDTAYISGDFVKTDKHPNGDE